MNTDTQNSPRLELGGSHHLPPYSILCGWHWAYIQMVFLSRESRMGVLKSHQRELSQLWSPINLRIDLRWKCGLKQSCSFRQGLSNGMWHIICSQVNWVDSWLFLVESETGTLTPGPSFGHNLCFRCLNEQCEPILNIHVPRAFQWYKKRHKPLIFDPSNRSLKFWESIGTPSPKVRVALGVSVSVHSLTFFYTLGSMWCDSWASFWPTPLQCLCLDSRASFLLAHNLATLLPWSGAQS
jgi:hypothetical protein